jgi:glycosyltransferase involved in cell wall biosynthesis
MNNEKQLKKIKVLFFIEQHSISYKYFENILVELKKMPSFEVEVFNLISNKEVNDHLAQFCSGAYTFTNNEPYKKQVFNVKEFIRKSNPDIIHAHEVIPAFYAAMGLMAGFSGIKMIFHRHHSFYRNKATKIMERVAFFRCNIAVSVSKTTQQVAFKEHPFGKKKIVQFYNGIGVADNGIALPVDMEPYNGVPKIVLLARLRARKGHDTAIAAINIVRKKIPGAVLFFAGEGDFRKEIETMIAARGVQKNVVLLGDVQNIMPLMNKMDISILPSESEAFNLSILETFASRRLSIASDLPSIRECITDGETGVLVIPGNAAQLAERIIYYLENETERNRIAGNGYKLYEQEFTTAVMVNKIAMLYKSLLA